MHATATLAASDDNAKENIIISVAAQDTGNPPRRIVYARRRIVRKGAPSLITFGVSILVAAAASSLSSADCPYVAMSRAQPVAIVSRCWRATYAATTNALCLGFASHPTPMRVVTAAARRQVPASLSTQVPIATGTVTTTKTMRTTPSPPLFSKPFAVAASSHRRRRTGGATRLFGSNPTHSDASPGQISIYDEQTALPSVDVAKLERTLSIIRDIVGYPTYDIALILCDDDYMRDVNCESRGINSPTDILSFPFQDVIIEPGILGNVEFDVPDYYCLGEMIVDVPYVMRRCEEDRLVNEERGIVEVDEEDPNDLDAIEEEHEWFDDTRGVSGAMSRVYDAERRIQMLLVHGILHLVGYDHMKKEEYEVMVAREEEVLQTLTERLKEDEI